MRSAIDVAGTAQHLIAIGPEAVRYTGCKNNRLARAGVAWRLTLDLVAKAPLDDGQAFVLLGVDVHERPGARLHLVP